MLTQGDNWVDDLPADVCTYLPPHHIIRRFAAE